MARVPYFDPDLAEGPRAKAAFGRIGADPANIFRMLGHSGEMIDGWTKLGTQILTYSSLDPKLREIAIIRTGVMMKSDYVRSSSTSGSAVGSGCPTRCWRGSRRGPTRRSSTICSVW
jgi:hypothetical protein